MLPGRHYAYRNTQIVSLNYDYAITCFYTPLKKWALKRLAIPIYKAKEEIRY